MSPPGRPKGEWRSPQHEEAPGIPRVQVRRLTAADLPAVCDWLPPGAARPPAGWPADTVDDKGQPDADDLWLVAAAPRQHAGHPPGAPTVQAALCLRRAIGLDLPRPWYHVGCVVHAAAALQLFHRQHLLQLGHDHTGASELADVAWDRGLPLAAQASALQALVADALARVQAQRSNYAASLIVELPGLRDADGASPFWQGLGRHFYTGDPRAAAERFGPAWRSHVAALLPRQPVYTAFLPPAAQAAIAQVAPSARVLLEVLWQAGFRYSHHVSVEDGGPVFERAFDSLPGCPGSS